MTPRTPLPKAALAAIGEAQEAAREAAQILRQLLRKRPQDTDLAAALAQLARAETRLGEARQVGKGGSMEGQKRTRRAPSGDMKTFALCFRSGNRREYQASEQTLATIRRDWINWRKDEAGARDEDEFDPSRRYTVEGAELIMNITMLESIEIFD